MKNKKLIIWGINLSLGLIVVILAWIFGPSVITEARYQQEVKAASTGKPTVGFSGMMVSMSGFKQLANADVVKPLSTQFGLVIPKIFVNVSVTENVNPEDVKAYQSVLKQAGGVAHAVGTAVPGENGTVYIFGHSTDATFDVERFNAVFYLLGKLEKGDKIIAYYNNVPYNYIVAEKKVVDPTDISDIIDVTGEERLVLQTCWPPGTTWKRLLIIAQPEQK
ncbi:MAG: sortase [Candidatus Beckwithbacteria bacterium]|nr:sortase [Candidatus Beckwithbacteria bacterium]